MKRIKTVSVILIFMLSMCVSVQALAKDQTEGIHTKDKNSYSDQWAGEYVSGIVFNKSVTQEDIAKIAAAQDLLSSFLPNLQWIRLVGTGVSSLLIFISYRQDLFLDISDRNTILKLKEQPPTRWVDKFMSRKSTPRLVKVLGWFFYVALLTKRKNECK